MITENAYELELIKTISANKGWKYLDAEQIYELRGRSFSNVLLTSKIEEALKRINPGITELQVNEAIAAINSINLSTSIIEANIKFQEYITHGIKVDDVDKKRKVTINIMDRTNNGIDDEWIITNQFKQDSRHPNYNKQKPDMVAFCNGIPLIVFELKTLKDSDNLVEAYNQMENYKEFLPDLFVYNAFNIIANVSLAKYGSLTSKLSRYQYWRKIPESNIESNDYLFTNLLDKQNLNNLIRDFTFYTSETNPSKIVASNHQFYGVRKALDNSAIIINDKSRKENGKAGIFWHTQGSGKSFSMLFLVKNLSQIVPGTTFIIVTDRNDLDNQLNKTFLNAEGYIGQKIHQISSIENLKEELKDRKQDGVYFTTVQKFNDTIGELSDRRNILVISDEAHRSHNNIDTTYEFSNEEQKVVEKQGNAIYLRKAFPKATFIGFTGTPIKNEDKSTERIFGPIISKYLMTDAERDGIVVPIKYESRKPEAKQVKEELEKLNQQHSEALELIEQGTELPGEVKKKFDKALQQMKIIIKDPDRIELVSKDFIKHYEERKDILKGKAMFVAFDRHIAFEYYKKIVELRPEWKDNVKLIVTSNNQQDDPEMLELTKNSKYRKEMAEEFKKEDSDFKIAIVVDMWLTGFDVPCLDVIYLDKPIKMHNLMQTIARTNRVYTKGSKNKDYGLVVDYIGLWNQLKLALSFYSGRDMSEVENERDIRSLKFKHIKEVENIIKQFNLTKIFNNEELWKDKNNWVRALKISTSKISEMKLKSQFVKYTKDIHKWIKEVLVLLDDHELFKFQMLKLIRSNIINTEMGTINFTEMESQLVEQINRTVKFDETIVVKEVEGNAILLSSIIAIIDKEIDNETEYFDTDIKVAAMKRLIDYTKAINYRKSRDFSEKLNDMLNRYDKAHITIEQLREELLKLSMEVREMTNQEKDEQGFTREEMAFLEIIRQPEISTDFDKDKIAEITRELLEVINNCEEQINYWTFNEQAKMSVRKELKVLLGKHKYPPDIAETTTEEIVDQIMYQKGIKH